MTDSHQDLDLIPAIAPGKDAIVSRRRHAEAPRQSNFNGVFAFSLVLMAIVLGFALFKVQQRLDQSNTLLEQANKGVRDLEDRLAATGTDVSEEIKIIQEKQADYFSEIDKLWKVAHRQNRPSIQALQTRLDNINNSQKTLDININRQTLDFSTLSAEFIQLQTDLLKVRDNLISKMNTADKQRQNQSVLVKDQQRTIASMEGKIKEVEADIQVFNKYRQQINQRLLELQRQIRTQSNTEVPGA